MQSFIGFGDIPTDFIDNYPFSTKCIAVFKGIIIKVIKHSIRLAIDSNGNVDMLVKLIQVLTTKEIQHLISTTDKIRYKKAIINQLVMFKNDIRIFGDKYAMLV